MTAYKRKKSPKVTHKPVKMWAVIDKDEQEIRSVHTTHYEAANTRQMWPWWKVVPVLVQRVK